MSEFQIDHPIYIGLNNDPFIGYVRRTYGRALADLLESAQKKKTSMLAFDLGEEDVEEFSMVRLSSSGNVPTGSSSNNQYRNNDDNGVSNSHSHNI